MQSSAGAGSTSEDAPLHVVATAGHVDHGKSALILRLTGIDPDRLAEEKRRGLTIDLGFAWTTLPSGREVGFVDVPGHERFIRNMLAGVGPVRLVLFVVAADEGWKPQSEEHLQILDVLGTHGAVVALTKADLVDEEVLAIATDEVRDRLTGTAMGGARIVPCSAATGAGLEELRTALDAMLASAPPPEDGGRPRQFVDRVFTIRGAGTVVTGTLSGGRLAVGQEAEILPSGHRARIRDLQTHKRAIDVARPVSRVAVNLTGTPREEVDRGDALVLPGQWRATSVMDAAVRPVRGLDHPLTSRGAYKLYAGSAERDVRIRFFTADRQLRPPHDGFARITLSRPLVLDFRDHFVLREAGRRETVGGGFVVDLDPPRRPIEDRWAELVALSQASREEGALLLVRSRGAVRGSDVFSTLGVEPRDLVRGGMLRLDGWLVAPESLEQAAARLEAALGAHHAAHPLSPGIELPQARALLAEVQPAFGSAGLADLVLTHLSGSGRIAREATTVRHPSHRPSTSGREDADRLVRAVRSEEPSAPTVRELLAQGFGADLVAAVCAERRLIRVSADIVATPELLARAEAIVRERGTSGITVSSFREALGTSRKYALPILEYFDGRGLTRRTGDLRILRS